MRVLADHLGRIAGVVDENFLRGDDDVDGVAVGVHVKGAVGRELQQVQAGEVAGGVIQEHVLAARVAGVDSRRVLRGVPAVDGGVELHAGIAAVPGGFGNFAQQFFGFVGLNDIAGANGTGGEVGVADYRVHEVIGDADGVVRVLEEDGRVGIGAGRRPVVSGVDQGPGLGLLLSLIHI